MKALPRIRFGTGLPPVEEFKTALFKILKALPGGKAPKDLYPLIADALKLTDAETKIRHEGGRNEPAFHILIRTARKELVTQGYLHRLPRNYWRLTDSGLNAERDAMEFLKAIGL